MEVQSLLVTRLAVHKSGELFSVTKQELDGKACSVILEDQLRRKLAVGAAQDDVTRLIACALIHDHDNAHCSFERDAIDDQSVERQARLNFATEVKAREVGKCDLA